MILGKSPAMQTIHTTIHQLSNNSERTVLIMDEIGVGKELVAQAIRFGEPERQNLMSQSIAVRLPRHSGNHFLWPCPWRIHRSDGKS